MSAVSIPRFLLPQRSPICAIRLSSAPAAVRHASNKSIGKGPSKAPGAKPSKSSASPAAKKPLVLEKPTKFNPPSHPARLRREPPRYLGPALSEEEKRIQRTKKYPNMMPPEGTVMHKFLTNRTIHIYITLGTLCFLAFYTFIENFKRTSKFADMLPPVSDIFMHPVAFVRTYLEVVKLHTIERSERVAQSRRAKVEDVQKRNEYRKAHDMIDSESLTGWTVKSDAESLGPAIPLGDAPATTPAAEGAVDGVPMDEQARKPTEPRKKFMGIW